MKKILTLLTIITISAVNLFSTNVNAANANDFHFTDFKAEYYLSRDSDNRAKMKVRETLVAIFPETNQNRGIERAIPKKNDGHLIFNGELKVWRNGEEEEIGETESENGVEIFRIGNKNRYVHGEQEYVLEYTLTDVIISDAGFQELYWNVNGDQWSQNFDRVQAQIHLDEDIANNFTEEIICFSGFSGSKQSCGEAKLTDDGAVFSSNNLSSRQTLTFSMRFKDGTFAEYEQPAWVGIVMVIFMVLAGGIFVLGIINIIGAFKKGRSTKTNQPIIPQYLPPKGINILNASQIYSKNASNIVTPAILGLAVNDKIKIKETEVDRLFGKKAKRYVLELVTKDGTDSFERHILNAFFPGSKKEYVIKSSDTVIGTALNSAIMSTTASFNRSDYYREEKGFKKLSGTTLGISILALIASIVAIASDEAFNDSMAAAVVLLIISSLATMVISIVCLSLKPKSLKGAEMKDYLKGLEMYMKLAEADRIKFLQSVESAERISTDSGSIVKLYEKLLPYATIFGLEKSWAKVLEVQYQSSSPDWYVGNTAFNAVLFASTMSSLSSSLNSYSSSSGSGGGGFSGGGSAGGGGGGGGGGGW